MKKASQRAIPALAVAACALCISPLVHGHAVTTNYLVVNDSGNEQMDVVWDIAATDVHWALGLDSDHDGRVLWSEVLAQHSAIAQLSIRHLTLRRGGMDCTPRLQDIMLTKHASETHISLLLTAHCPRAGDLQIASTLFI